MKSNSSSAAVTITLNPAVDRTLTIPNFAAGKVNRVEAVRDLAGGKGVNVAAALADFGFRVAATGFLGEENAEIFESFFARKKIVDHFIRLPGTTRVGIKISDPIQQQTTDINFPGLSPKGADVKELFQAIRTMGQGRRSWFVLGGSLPPKVNVKVYGELITKLKADGHSVLLDTSGSLRHGIDAAPNIIKPNIHELEELTGTRLKTDQAIIRAARQMIARGVELVVVSMGERGACFVNGSEVVMARPPQVEVKSTVGAGDAMVAGIIAAQLRQESLENCARLATAFSLEILTQAERGLRSATAIKAWMQRVKIER